MGTAAVVTSVFSVRPELPRLLKSAWNTTAAPAGADELDEEESDEEESEEEELSEEEEASDDDASEEDEDDEAGDDEELTEDGAEDAEDGVAAGALSSLPPPPHATRTRLSTSALATPLPA